MRGVNLNMDLKAELSAALRGVLEKRVAARAVAVA